MKIGQYETHPLADKIPLLEGEELELFKGDVKLRGLFDNKVWLYQDRILDGRDRYRVSLELGLEVEFVEYTGDDPLGFVLSKWRFRKHHNATQRAMIAAALVTFTQGRPTKRKSGSAADLKQGELAAAAGVSERQLRAAGEVHKKGSTELVAAATRGDISAETAAELAKLPKDEQLERLKAELDPARPRRARNDNGKRETPIDAESVMRVVRRTLEQLGGTTKAMVADGDEKVVLQVAYAGALWRVEVAKTGTVEVAA